MRSVGETTPPEDLNKPPEDCLTFADGNFANGIYTTDAGITLKNDLSLMNGAFSGYIQFSGESGQQFLLGGNGTPYAGLYFLPWSGEEGSMALVAASGEFDNIVYFNDTTAKTNLIGKENKWTISLTPTGNGDVKLGVWFNDVLYNDTFITLTKAGGNCEALFGAANGIHITPAAGTVAVRSIGDPVVTPTEPEVSGKSVSPDKGLKKISFSSFGIKDGVYRGNESADFAASGEYVNPAGESTLDGTLFEADITFSSVAGCDFRIGGKENAWFGLMFYSAGDSIYMVNAEKTTDQWYPVQFLPSLAGTQLTDKEMNFKLALQYVDHTKNGKKDDLRIGVWFNGKLYRNQYIYYDGYGDGLGTKLGIYCAKKESCITIKSVAIETSVNFDLFGFGEQWETYFENTVSAETALQGVAVEPADILQQDAEDSDDLFLKSTKDNAVAVSDRSFSDKSNGDSTSAVWLAVLIALGGILVLGLGYWFVRKTLKKKNQTRLKEEQP